MGAGWHIGERRLPARAQRGAGKGVRDRSGAQGANGQGGPARPRRRSDHRRRAGRRLPRRRRRPLYQRPDDHRRRRPLHDIVKDSPVDNAPFAPGSVSIRIYLHDGLPAPEIVRYELAQAKRAVEVGFDGVMMGEHHGGFPGYIPNTIQTAGWMLNAMPHGWVAPAPVLLPLKPWALIAEEIAWLSAAFPGRVGFGAGTGSWQADFDIMELSKDDYIETYHRSLGLIAKALRGEAEGEFAKDWAIMHCRQAPVPLVTASATPRGVRAAAANGAGILFESMTAPERLRELAGKYRDAGGTGPIILIRRVWMGEGTFGRQDKQMGVYRGYGSDTTSQYWQGNQLINGDADEVAERLAEAAREVGADAINLRVQVPGVQPDEMMDQIERLGPMVAKLKGMWPWKT
ncbi:LLM class flavin-dependent oxidoreductase [Sphingomonas crocodyli]|uniref:LLM class flavin-dependent oxidoreductase n=1 Tax=Sphingomonas crocodyli TaxID=1979270 RepID=A0A437M7T1_9SPHN|nr:LLM class flavin-dependent oxidoreductase [Sphingomonas crocodyli]